jgi:hypothetical protein
MVDGSNHKKIIIDDLYLNDIIEQYDWKVDYC